MLKASDNTRLSDFKFQNQHLRHFLMVQHFYDENTDGYSEHKHTETAGIVMAAGSFARFM